MDLYKAIRDLYAEKKRLDEVIMELEKLLEKKVDAGEQAPTPSRKRIRKRMSAEQRRRVSERMKKYWADRRARESKL
jgi:hypothetical protein